MRIQLLSQYFDPEPTLKGLTFAKALAARGHDVRVVTGFPNYPSGHLADGYSLRWRQFEEMDGIPIQRVWLYPSHDTSAAHRALNYGSFAFSSAAFGRFKGWRPELTWVHHPPPTAALSALLRRGLAGTPFALEIQDLWPDTLTSTGMITGTRVPNAIGWGMQHLYRASSHLICISDGFADRLRRRGIEESKISVIPNWADEARLHADADDEAWANSLLDPGAFNVVYAGNMGPAQALEPVVQSAAIAAKSVPHLVLHMVGDGLDHASLLELAAELPDGLVRFHHRQSMGRVAALVRSASAAVVHLKRDPLFEITIPSKIQAYLFLGAPLIVGVRGDAARLIEKSGAGVAAEPQDPQSLAAAMVRLAGMSPEERCSLGASGRRYYESQLSIRAGIEKYEAAFAMATARGRRPR